MIDGRLATVVLLPDTIGRTDLIAHWWIVSDGMVKASGEGSEWASADGTLIGLAPTSSTRVVLESRDQGMSPAQAAGIARIREVERSLGDPVTLHVVASPDPRDDHRQVIATTANAVMLDWIEWAEQSGRTLDAIVPASLAVDAEADWAAAAVGSDAFVISADAIFPDEPPIRDALLPPDADVAQLPAQRIEQGITEIAADHRPNLRSGRFAVRRVIIDRATVRQLGLLLIAIVAVTTLIAIAEILRLDSSRRRLDAETLAMAQQLGGAGTTLEDAEATVAARSGGAIGTPLAAVLRRIQAEPSVSMTALGYNDGTLMLTLAAPESGAINRVLLPLQREGYQVTAVPRQGSDGRTMADLSVRSAS